MPTTPTSARTVLRIVLIIVAVVLLLYLIYLLQRPITWLCIAIFLSVALSGPVDRLAQVMRRGFAIAFVLVSVISFPIVVGALLVPPLVTQGNALVNNAPQYAEDVEEYVAGNQRLRELNEDYDLVGRLQEQAQELPSRIGDAAGVLQDIGLGVVNSLFALFTILVMTAFLLGSGRRWIDAGVGLLPEDRQDRMRRILRGSSKAVGGYVGGALLVSLINGILTFLVLTILGVPFSGALGLVAGLFSLVPLVGATIGAIIIAIVTLFTNFPTATIVWIVWAIVYQQVENNVLQPQIQKRTVDIHPFVVFVAVLFGGTLLGVLGALVAIPVAAMIQIVLRELWSWRQELRLQAERAATATSEGSVTYSPALEPMTRRPLESG